MSRHGSSFIIISDHQVMVMMAAPPPAARAGRITVGRGTGPAPAGGGRDGHSAASEPGPASEATSRASPGLPAGH